ncbi:MAG: FAD/NAD(P)-binding protein [Planctomycetota bacterium]
MTVNAYLPEPVIVDKITVETEDKLIKTFRLKFKAPEGRGRFDFKCGQFGEVSVLGKGESPFGVASSPLDREFVEFTVMKVGAVTTHLHLMEEGEELGLRGPLGNWYPLDTLKGRNLVIIGGGFAFTTLRSTIKYILDPALRGDFGTLDVIYGARTPGMLLYKEELKAWQARKDIRMHVTVDKAVPGWDGLVGFVPAITEKVAPSANNASAIVCGPPVMIKFTLPVLAKLGFAPENIITSLEMRMKCGIGKCGRCNIGRKYVCKDGPVFTLAELKKLPDEY